MVVGECGMGKTTFVRNLFAAYAQSADLTVHDASAATSQGVFLRAPDELCTEIVVKDEVHLVAYHYQVQDTPGYNDDAQLETGMQDILDYIEENNWRYMEMEQDPLRGGPMSRVHDPRVDACLYFVPPHRLKQVDVLFMTRLAELVPVIPVLAKADSMTSQELEEFRERVRASLQTAGKGIIHQFTEETLREAGSCPPFAVIASNVMDHAVGGFWPVRRYPWGTCEALRSAHSDLTCLKKLLFEVGYEELKGETEKRYYGFRKEQLLQGKGRDCKDISTAQRKGLYRNRQRRSQGPKGFVAHVLHGVRRVAVAAALLGAGQVLLTSTGGPQKIAKASDALHDKVKQAFKRGSCGTTKPQPVPQPAPEEQPQPPPVAETLPDPQPQPQPVAPPKCKRWFV